MRLWTFQSVDAMESILSTNSWFSDKSKSKRAWSHDVQLMPDVEHVPIYCFGSAHNGDPLSLRTFAELWTTFNTYYGFSLDCGERFMLELEVPEDEVFAARFAGDAGSWDYVYSDFKKHIRESDKIADVVLPYIKRSWIVCYRIFYASKTDYKRFICDTVETHVLRPDAFPLWIGNVDLSHDGNLFDEIRTVDVYREELLECEGEYPSEKELIMRHGMSGCPRYFTVREAAECCNKQTINRIYARLMETGKLKSVNDEMTIMDLFPTGLT